MKLPKIEKTKYDLISISHYFPPRIGGLENMAFALLKGLSKKDIKCLSVFGSNQRYEINEDGFKKISFKPLNIFNNTYPIFGINFFFYILNILKRNPNAKIILHSRHLTSSFLAHLACLLLSRPYTVIEHNAGKIYFNSIFATKVVNWLDRNIFESVITNAQDIVAVSETGKKWICKNFNIEPERVDIIYNSYDLENEKIDLKEKENIIVWASKWIAVKNPQVVLKTYLQIAEKHPTWLFMIIGEGSDLKYENIKLPKNVRIVEKLLKRNDFFELLSKSKIYINSSFSEGLAIANLEAIAYGNIPVLSNAPSNIEIAKKIGSNEFVFRRNNSKDLAKTLEKAIRKSSNQNYIKEIISRNKEYFSNDEMLEKYYLMLLPKHYKNERLETLSIVIPVYNEESTVSEIIGKVAQIKLPNNIKKEIVIVDDGSRDGSDFLIKEATKKVYKDTKFVLLENRKNLGKSQTVKTGILASKGDFVVVQDADLEYEPKDLTKFVEMFKSDPYLDVIYGNRFNKNNIFFNSVHEIGNRFVTYSSNLFTKQQGFAPKDMETCYKMVRGDIMRSIFKSLESTSNFGLEPELTAKLSRYRELNGEKLKFKEIDIYYNPRSISQGKKMRWFKNGLEALLEILYFNTNSFTIEEINKGKIIKRKF